MLKRPAWVGRAGPPFLVRLGRSLVEIACIWELIALHHDEVPTLSKLIQLHRHRKSVRAVLIPLAVWLIYHLAVEERVVVVVNPEVR